MLSASLALLDDEPFFYQSETRDIPLLPPGLIPCGILCSFHTHCFHAFLNGTSMVRACDSFVQVLCRLPSSQHASSILEEPCCCHRPLTPGSNKCFFFFPTRRERRREDAGADREETKSCPRQNGLVERCAGGGRQMGAIGADECKPTTATAVVIVI